ncbi:TetR/AcrR family transcriptional regulator [Pseudonocardia sp. GCM10023141]|uniref:TetR/AcrR family transcriptional regulator n=1 Tax=Pseudonocardia sp. GCM10023141 TaxID=3252653 RepID=UPI00360F332A
MTVSGAAAATTRKTIAPGPSTRRRLLDIDLILDTALALIDEHGRLTMTELAARLGTSASAVYHHVSGRAAIIELLRERIAGPLGWPPPESSDWAAEIADWMRGYRRVMAEHPNVIPLLTAQRPPRHPGAGRRRGRGPPQARRRRVRARARALMVGMRHRIRDRATLDGG